VLGTAAWLASLARGDLGIHGGAVAADGGAWGVLAGREGGKSSLLAVLAGRGCEIVADDMLIVAEAETQPRVFAGPRCIDLRPDAGARLGVAHSVRRGEKRRMALPPAAAEHRLLGFVHLGWDDARVAVRTLPVTEALGRLDAHAAGTRAHIAAMLELAGLPHVALARPRDWEQADAAADALLAAIADPPGP
jgi:hypothetical protein